MSTCPTMIEQVFWFIGPILISYFLLTMNIYQFQIKLNEELSLIYDINVIHPHIINKLSSIVVSTTSNASTSYIRAPIEICNDWPVFCKYLSYVYYVYLCLFAVGIFLNTQIKAVLMCIDKRSVLQTDVYSLFKFVKNQMYEKKVLCLFLNPYHYKI